MDDPSNDQPIQSKQDLSRTYRTEPRKHYFHFATNYSKTLNATLVISGKALDVTIPEQTQFGFTALGSVKVAEALRLGVRWVLKVEGKRFEVYPQWIHCAADGRVQMGLRRMHQLASDEEPNFVQRFRSRFKPDGQWALVMAVIVMVMSSAWLMRKIYQPPEMHTRGQTVRLDSRPTLNHE